MMKNKVILQCLCNITFALLFAHNLAIPDCAAFSNPIFLTDPHLPVSHFSRPVT